MSLFNSKADDKDWFALAETRRAAFLQHIGFNDIEALKITSDAAPRNFFRLEKEGKRFILMESPPDDHHQSIAGHRLDDFIRVAEGLRSVGLSAPKVFEQDLKNGYLLVEDFGDLKYNKVIDEHPEKERLLYEYAVDALIVLRDNGFELSKSCPDFFGGYLHSAHRQFVDWFVPYFQGEQVSDECISDFLQMWKDIELLMLNPPLGAMYVDYHIENLIYLPDREGVASCGLLDFAMMYHGVPAYDIAHLTMDARRSISIELKKHLINRYVSGLKKDDKDMILNCISIMGMHFHLKVAGQIIRWVYEGKGTYFIHLPRVVNYIRTALEEPCFAPLMSFLNKYEVDLNMELPPANREQIAELIRDDAFLKS